MCRRNLAGVMGQVALVAVLATAWPAVAQEPILTADRWTRTALEFMEALRSGETGRASALVVPELAAGPMSPDALAAIWDRLTAQMGPLHTLAPHRLSEQGEYRLVELTGRFERQEFVILVSIDGDGRVAGFRLLPAAETPYEMPPYADTTTFVEREVTVGREPWVLPGTLALPRGAGPHPAVVLVHGSGPNDRDQTIGPNRPFRDLAWGLASRGVAVLRYEKRTRALGHLVDPLTITVDGEVIDDAVAALALLRTTDGIDPDRVFVLGHSLGATVAPLIAQRDAQLAGAILLAPMARPFAQVIREQLEYLRSLHHSDDPDDPNLAAMTEILDSLAELEAGLLPDTARVLGGPVAYIRDLDARQVVDVARRTPVPHLILQGERDYQVTMEDFALWRDALADRHDVTFRSYPDLDHLFMAGTGPSTPQEVMGGQRKVAQQVVDDVARWITSRR